MNKCTSSLPSSLSSQQKCQKTFCFHLKCDRFCQNNLKRSRFTFVTFLLSNFCGQGFDDHCSYLAGANHTQTSVAPSEKGEREREREEEGDLTISLAASRNYAPPLQSQPLKTRSSGYFVGQRANIGCAAFSKFIDELLCILHQ